jgi:ATP-binding cassette subfamily B protein/subfamily B ATP-binding cassette protein MsbA
MQTVRRLLGYARPHRATLAVAVLIALIGVALELARPWPVKVVVDYALQGEPLPPDLDAVRDVLPGAESDGGLIAWSVAFAVVISVGAAVAALLSIRLVMRAAFKMVGTFATQTFTRLQQLSLSFHQRNHVGDLLQRTSSDVFSVQTLITGVLFPFLIASITLAGMFVIMASIDVGLALIALLVVPAQALTFALFVRPLTRTTDAQWREQGRAMNLIENILGAIKAVQGFRRERYFRRRFSSEADRLCDVYYSAAIHGTGYEQAVSMVTALAAAAMLGVGAVQVRNGVLTLGDLLVFLAYLATVYGPVQELARGVGLAAQVGVRARRVFEILDSDEEIVQRPSARPLIAPRGEVEFDAVTFGYDRAEPAILEDVSFVAPAGTVTAIVGISGAGKTSLMSLLSRFADPWSGHIRIDGVDIADLTLDSLRSNVGLVLQDPYLLPMSAAENIVFGLEGADRSDIRRAAEAAHAHQFIKRLPQGYNTVVGERGATLSGGERQRLAIARALLTDAPILVLDEPTSALDADTEREVFAAINELLEGRTAFIISHRLSTIRHADQIITIDGGRIAEVGTHAGLLDAEGVYSTLFRHQLVHAAELG